MGLDGVEIVMAVEERFGIEISNQEAERIITPRELIDLVLTKVIAADVATCLSRRAFYAIRRSIVQEMKCDRNAVRPDSSLESLIPRKDRGHHWALLQRRVAVRRWPQLCKSIRTICAAALLGAGVFYWFFLRELHPTFRFPLAIGAAVVVVGSIFSSRSLKVEFPVTVRTVGELAQFLVGQAPELFEPEGRKWARGEVAAVVREIVTEVIGCNNYTEDSRFVEDLGLS